MTKFKAPVSAVAVAVFFVACGGGGGSDNAATTPLPIVPTPAPAPLAPPADLQSSVPAFTYASNSVEHEFATVFNQFRAQVGLGLLAQNVLLDKAARNHLEYVLKNDVLNGGTVDMRTFDPATGRPMFHIEASGKPLFTGVQEMQRATSVGYPGMYVGESGTFGGGKGAQAAFSSLSSTVYHRAGLMFQSPREVGVAVGQDASQTFVLEFGYEKPQTNASDFLGVDPAANQTAVRLHAGVETPNPFPDLSTANADFPTKTGYPVSVVVKEGAILEVLTFSLTEAGATSFLDARMMTSGNDPNRYLPSNMAFLVAKAPLKSNTTYSVSLSGRVGNVVVDKDWKFTTGS